MKVNGLCNVMTWLH